MRAARRAVRRFDRQRRRRCAPSTPRSSSSARPARDVGGVLDIGEASRDRPTRRAPSLRPTQTQARRPAAPRRRPSRCKIVRVDRAGEHEQPRPAIATPKLTDIGVVVHGQTEPIEMALRQARQFGGVGQSHRRNRRRPLASSCAGQAHVPSEGSVRHLDVPGHLDVVPDGNGFTEQADQLPIGLALGRSRKQLRERRDAIHAARVKCRWAEQMRFDRGRQPGPDEFELRARRLGVLPRRQQATEDEHSRTCCAPPSAPCR